MASCKAEAVPCEVVKVRDDARVDMRHAGCGVVVGDKLYLWGGETQDKTVLTPSTSDEEDDDEEDDEEDPIYRVVTLPRHTNERHPFDVFDMMSMTWSIERTHGATEDIPDLGIGSTLSYHRDTHSLYLYGGWNNRKFSSDVYCVSMDSWRWEKVTVLEGEIKPSPRYLTGVLVHGDKLCNFGGVGPDIVKDQDIGSKYHGSIDKGVVYEFGWNNEYYEFDVNKRKWEAPMSGNDNRPPPVGAHVFTKFDSHHAIYFGGRTESGRTDVTYLFDLDKKEFEGPLILDTKPRHRVFTALCPLIDPSMVGKALCPGGPAVEQTLLLLWGKENIELIVDDCWLFHGDDMTWSKMGLGEVGRYWHIACPYFCEPGKTTEGQVVVYGGSKHDTLAGAVQFSGLRDLTILSFGIKSLKKLCLSVIVRALDQHGELRHDQFPDHVPTAIKQSILDNYTACTHTYISTHLPPMMS